MDAPYLQKLAIVGSRVPDYETWPFSMPFVKGLELAFTTPVTIFVGENGSGKSTVLEAIADLLDLPVAGGSKNEAPDRHGPERRSPLAPCLLYTSASRGGARGRQR